MVNGVCRLAFVNFFALYTWGAVFLGGGVEMNPGKLRLGFIYGRFNKAIEADSSKTSNVFTQVPAYKRTGMLSKLVMAQKKTISGKVI